MLQIERLIDLRYRIFGVLSLAQEDSMKTSFVRLSLFFSVFASLALGELAQAHPWGPSRVPPQTEIQIFVNYVKRPGKDTYDYKVVSTWQAPKSGEYLYFEHWENPSNAACFWGEPDDAFKLMKEMMTIFNYEKQRNIELFHDVYFDASINRLALKVWTVDEAGRVNTWFDRMRECNRRSTPAERRN